jgi:hypothetical protein
VQILSQEVVGPYDSATLRSTDPSALVKWLTQNNYEIPASIQPTIDAYVSEGFDFIALRLRPGAGVQAMQPVRVRTPGADPTLPLRMVAAGVGANVGIVLYVIGQGRYETQSFPNGTVNDASLVWDPIASQSNYEALAEAVMARANGRTWLTEYATMPDLSGRVTTSGNPGLAYAYRTECIAKAPLPCPDAGASDADAGDAGDASDVSDASDAEASEGGQSDAATPVCIMPSSSCDDLDVVTSDITFGGIWVTRLRAILPSDALGEGDLVLQANATQSTVNNVHQVPTPSLASPIVDPKTPTTPTTSASCTSSRNGSWMGTGLLVAVTALIAGSFLRRRR